MKLNKNWKKIVSLSLFVVIFGNSKANMSADPKGIIESAGSSEYCLEASKNYINWLKHHFAKYIELKLPQNINQDILKKPYSDPPMSYVAGFFQKCANIQQTKVSSGTKFKNLFSSDKSDANSIIYDHLLSDSSLPLPTRIWLGSAILEINKVLKNKGWRFSFEESRYEEMSKLYFLDKMYNENLPLEQDQLYKELENLYMLYKKYDGSDRSGAGLEDFDLHLSQAVQNFMNNRDMNQIRALLAKAINDQNARINQRNVNNMTMQQQQQMMQQQQQQQQLYQQQMQQAQMQQRFGQSMQYSPFQTQSASLNTIGRF